jgi:hypothetical protein
MSPIYKGDTMTVIYDPANPNSYIEDSWGSTWGATVGLGKCTASLHGGCYVNDLTLEFEGLLATLLGAAGIYTFTRALGEKVDLKLPSRNLNTLL